MIGFLNLIPDTVKIAIGFIIGAIVIGSTAYLVASERGETRGRALERADALQRSIELIQKRGKTNAQVGKLDDVALCTELGGVWMHGNCE